MPYTALVVDFQIVVSGKPTMLIRLLALISFVHSFVAADVKFIAPAGGAKVTAGAAIQIKLGESGTSTPITDLAGYTIYLMVGGNTVATSVGITGL